MESLRRLFFLLFISQRLLSQTPGTLDPTFGTGGKTSIPMGEAAYCTTITPEGKILLGGDGKVGSDFAFLLARLNTDGSLDNTFGGTGFVTTQFDDYGYPLALSVARQTDGKIIAAGIAEDIDGEYIVTLARYLPDGTLDSTFDIDGKVTTDIGPTSDVATSVAVQADGKIVVAGQTRDALENLDIFVMRYNTDGSLDADFGTGGITVTPIGNHSFGNGMAIQSDGKIVVAGATGAALLVVRYKTNGALDPTFGTDGIVTVPNTSGGNAENGASAVVIQPDQKIVATGYSIESPDNLFLLVRLNPSGTLDNTFSDDGLQTASFGGGDSYGYAVALQPDGKILMAGDTKNGTDHDFAIARFNSDGSPDNTFSSDGKLTTDFGSKYDEIYGIAVAPDGKIVAAGSYYRDNTHFEMAVARYFSGLSVGVIDHSQKLCQPLIYSNPVLERNVTVKYELPAASSVRIELLDLLGRSLATILHADRPSGETSELLQLPEGLPNSIYWLNIRTEQGNSIVKINIQHH